MAEPAFEFKLPAADRVADAVPPLAWSAASNSSNEWWNNPVRSPVGNDATLQLPTLHMGDDVADPITGELSLNTGVKDNYSVNSDIAQLYLQNKAAIVRINTMDPKDDAGFRSSAGSGSIIDSSGIIATGYHVVKNATALQVKTADGSIYDAKILAADPAKDEALLQIISNNPFSQFSTVKLAADSHVAQPKEALLGLGFPKGVDDLHISTLAVDKRMRISDLQIQDGLLLGEDQNRAVIKTDGPVDKGDSGGPVFDRKTGEQVGIVNMNDFKNGNAYITPIEDFQQFLASTRAKYGIRVQNPASVDRTFIQPASPSPAALLPGTGLRNLDSILNKNHL